MYCRTGRETPYFNNIYFKPWNFMISVLVSSLLHLKPATNGFQKLNYIYQSYVLKQGYIRNKLDY